MYKKLKALIISSLFPLTYLICQLLVQVLFIYGASYYLGKLKAGSSREYLNSAISIANENIYILTLFSAICCFLVILLIDKIKKQNIFRDYKKVTISKAVFYSISTVGLYIIIVIMNSMLISFFPDYNQEIMEFFRFEQPVLGIVVIGIVAPLIEELIFRGEVYRELNKVFSVPVTIFLQALFFGLIHPIPLQKIQTFVMGLFFGYAREKTKNLWTPTIMHITNNMIACVLMFVVL